MGPVALGNGRRSSAGCGKMHVAAAEEDMVALFICPSKF